MNGLGRKILAVVAGLVAGSLVNMAVLGGGGQVIAPPAGSDTSTTEGLAASMHLFGARHGALGPATLRTTVSSTPARTRSAPRRSPASA